MHAWPPRRTCQAPCHMRPLDVRRGARLQPSSRCWPTPACAAARSSTCRLEDADLARQTIFVRTGKNAAARRTIHMTERVAGCYCSSTSASVRRRSQRTGIAIYAGARHGTLHHRGDLETQPDSQRLPLRCDPQAGHCGGRGRAQRTPSVGGTHPAGWLRAGQRQGLMANEGWTSSAMVAAVHPRRQRAERSDRSSPPLWMIRDGDRRDLDDDPFRAPSGRELAPQ
jgi:hypothetical protein